MRLALAMAREALGRGEVPVGAVIVRAGRVLAQAHNLREATHDPTAHAERLALTLAGRSLKTWHLEGCTLYATLEPCPMCAGAIVLSRISGVVYGAADEKAGACRSLYRLASDPRLNHQAAVRGGVMAEECGALLAEFFQARRRAGSSLILPTPGRVLLASEVTTGPRHDDHPGSSPGGITVAQT